MTNQTPELLAPAGSPGKLRWAVAYGADAVYLGLKSGSLRQFAGNFTMDEVEESIKHLHAHGRKGYVTLNITPHSDEVAGMIDNASRLEELKIDGLIVADLGFIRELKLAGIKTPIHISTQANVANYQTVMAYAELGAKRVNLARELSIRQIAEIQHRLQNEEIETEVFIHGAVCFSHSGRCAISDYLTGRGANRGECAQPCRWKYHLTEEKRPGEFFPVMEDDRGLYFFNSRDLALFPYVKELINLGVKSFKIEGRMKSVHYLASTLALYRKVLDGHEYTIEEGMKLLGRLNNRGYSSGFMKGNIDENDYSFEQSYQSSTSEFIAIALEARPDGSTIIEGRNKIYAGEELEILRPDGTLGKLVLPRPLTTIEGESIPEANNNTRFVIEESLSEYTILRRLKE